MGQKAVTGEKPNERELMRKAIERRDVQEMKRLISPEGGRPGVDVNNTHNNQCYIQIALQNNPSFEVIDCLVNNGLDVNAKMSPQGTVLHFLCGMNEPHNFVRYFLEKGTDPLKKNSQGLIPLQIACRNQKIGVEAVSLLLSSSDILISGFFSKNLICNHSISSGFLKRYTGFNSCKGNSFE